MTAALVVALSPAVVGCGEGDVSSGGASEADGALRGEVRVSVASSLSEAFAELAATFQQTHPGAEIRLNSASSALLETQIREGAPVDVFVPADRRHLETLPPWSDASSISPAIAARTRLQIAVPAGNPAAVRGLADFADPRMRLGLCAVGVPCGDLAREALARAGVTPAPDTNEPNVRALLTRIELGEVDAGIVYRTDVISASGRVEGLDIPDAINTTAEYPIVVLPDAPNPEAARGFVVFVLSARGRRVLARHGFELP